MATLRIEFASLGGGRGRLGGQVPVREEGLLGAVTLAVGATATASSARPAVPSTGTTVFADLTAIDAAIYAAIGSSPDPGAEPRLLLLPGRTMRVHVTAGHLVSAVKASDVPPAVQAIEQHPFAPIPGTTVSLNAGASATAAPVLLPACNASSYRVRNAAQSASAVAWRLGTSSGTAALLPIAAGSDGTGALPGDLALDVGAVEVIGLTGDEQAALAAGTLRVSAVCPAGGSAILSVTPGVGG